MVKKKQNYSDSDRLWGVDGPYSEAKLIVDSRILDDFISRVFIVVEVAINPYTFELVKSNRKKFNNDLEIQQLLDHAEFRGQAHGYVSMAFSDEFDNEEVMVRAQKRLHESEEMIIRLHKYVMEHLREDWSGAMRSLSEKSVEIG